MHRYLLSQKAGKPAFRTRSRSLRALDEKWMATLPLNNTHVSIPALFKAAHDLYSVDYSVHDAVMVMVVQPGERNVLDQGMLENALWEAHRIPLLRLTLLGSYHCHYHHHHLILFFLLSLVQPGLFAALRAAVLNRAELSQCAQRGADGQLLVQRDGATLEVSIVYFRSGYRPEDHPTQVEALPAAPSHRVQAEWAARLLIEQSRTIKCPDIRQHLAGCKKIQQVAPF
jgi:hypothetical protein